jgi:hypothetical protein
MSYIKVGQENSQPIEIYYEDHGSVRVSLSDIVRVLCYSVGISWIRKPLIPRIGCGRLAQFSGIGEENHVVSRVLQVAH